MASVTANTDKNGRVISYRFRCAVGADVSCYGKKIWRTMTVKAPGLTPAKELKQMEMQAAEWEREQRAEYARTGDKRERGKITLEKFLNEHWLPDAIRDGQHSSSTVRSCEFAVKVIVDFFGPKKRLKDIGPEDCLRFGNFLRTGKDYAPGTAKLNFSKLAEGLLYAERMGYIAASPTRRLSPREKPQGENKPVEFLSEKDAAVFVQKLFEDAQTDIYWRAVMLLLLCTGLRVGEACGLQWRDYDCQNLLLRVERTVTGNSQNKLSVGPPKNRKARVVPVPRRLSLMLDALKDETETVFGPVNGDAFIFPYRRDPYRALAPEEVRRWMRGFCERNGLPRYHPHLLRHTAASLALAGGANVKETQLLLGHSDSATTLRYYTGVEPDRLRKAVDAVENTIESAIC